MESGGNSKEECIFVKRKRRYTYGLLSNIRGSIYPEKKRGKETL